MTVTRIRAEGIEYNEDERDESDKLAALFDGMVWSVSQAQGVTVDRFSVVMASDSGVISCASINGRDGMIEDLSFALNRLGYTVVPTSVYESSIGHSTKEH